MLLKLSDLIILLKLLDFLLRAFLLLALFLPSLCILFDTASIIGSEMESEGIADSHMNE